VLTGAWRVSPDAQNLSEGELSLVTPLLYQSGDAALAWWRIRHSALATSETGALLHDAYRHLRLAARVHEREIKHVVSLLRAEDIEPVLVKGWAVARLYPDRALRPYGDIDLCVRPDQFTKAEGVLKRLESIEGHYVDLHLGFAKLQARQQAFSVPTSVGFFGAKENPTKVGTLNTRSWKQLVGRGRQAFRVPTSVGFFGAKKNPTRVGTLNTRSWDELFERSQLVDLDGEKIRVLCPEDHLRVLCLHLLRSGAWRPLWLCDVALVLETRAANFDWDMCLGKDQRQADSVVCTVGLAQQLLGVEKFAIRNSQFGIPGWLVPAVLRQWDRCRNSHAAGMALPTLLTDISEPKKVFTELYARWDNPVRSTAVLGGRFNNWPRLPYQLAELLLHIAEVPKQLRAVLRGRRASLRPIAADLRPLISDL
jgi:hypothetical protein